MTKGQKLDQQDEIAADSIQINTQFTHQRKELDRRELGQFFGVTARDDRDPEDSMLETNNSP